eukprot:CAMPEP_0118953454 /NCGR_PEP_ID=MMETSP1169-20130426/56589_1 /TAXON_ID=36882 /ORGANISM="Pyramimonas obovata, Strain CCMP722" /LENGTH=64 /DNA_ID=CAMNT_0006900913 /DNA_START=252 /DNA_END=443 /DNA_ORIENTATION=-
MSSPDGAASWSSSSPHSIAVRALTSPPARGGGGAGMAGGGIAIGGTEARSSAPAAAPSDGHGRP